MFFLFRDLAENLADAANRKDQVEKGIARSRVPRLPEKIAIAK